MHYYKAFPIGGRITQRYLSDHPFVRTVWAHKSHSHSLFLSLSVLTAILQVKLV